MMDLNAFTPTGTIEKCHHNAEPASVDIILQDNRTLQKFMTEAGKINITDVNMRESQNVFKKLKFKS